MKGTLLESMDIDLSISHEEFNDLRWNDKTLECVLKWQGDGDVKRKAKLAFKDFSDSGDGIKVDYDLETEIYTVTFNQHAADLINQRSCFGTRYGGGEKITIYIPDLTDDSDW